jgi:hypothetical protein
MKNDRCDDGTKIYFKSDKLEILAREKGRIFEEHPTNQQEAIQ